MKKVILTLIVVSTMFGLLNAAPFQTLGMLRTPDAYVLPHKAAEFMVAGYYLDIAQPQDAAFKGFMPYAMVGAGILDRLEIGAFVGSKVNDEPMVYFLNAKVKIWKRQTPFRNLHLEWTTSSPARSIIMVLT